jgi:integrase
MKKATVRDGENFLSYEEQRLVVGAIENPHYKKMIEVMAIYALRPCEIRALQWQDLDFRSGIIKIQRHFSRNKLVDMRKSNGKPHYLPMTERFIEIMQTVTRSFHPEEFVFKGKEGAALGEKVLSNAWKNAINKTGMRSIDLYEGIRHSRVSALLEKGYSEDQVMLLSGHETKDAFKRYGQIKAQSKLNLIREMM